MPRRGVTLGDDEYFVLCDDYNNNRDDSRLDSIGIIDSEQILGKVWMIRFAILTTWFGTLKAETTNHFNKAPAYAAQGKEQEFYYEYNNGIRGI